MTDFVVVDTDVVSFLLKGDTRAQAYRSHLQDKVLALSFMTVAELYRWAYERQWGPVRQAWFRRTAACIHYFTF